MNEQAFTFLLPALLGKCYHMVCADKFLVAFCLDEYQFTADDRLSINATISGVAFVSNDGQSLQFQCAQNEFLKCVWVDLTEVGYLGLPRRYSPNFRQHRTRLRYPYLMPSSSPLGSVGRVDKCEHNEQHNGNHKRPGLQVKKKR